MIPSTIPRQPVPDRKTEKGSAANERGEGQVGQGGEEGLRDSRKSIKDYLQEADVQRDAAAKPSPPA